MANIGFIGSGMMAEAIIGGMLKGGFSSSEIWGSDPQISRREYMQEKYGITVTGDNKELVNACNVLVLAVKPQYYGSVVPELQKVLRSEHRIISIMAGITTARMEEDLRSWKKVPRKAVIDTAQPAKPTGEILSIIRVIPNTPAVVGAGITAICAGSQVEQADMDLAKQIFSAVGSVVDAEEHLINAISGVSSCGPAYVYMMIQALADGGVMMGLPRHLAHKLAAEMVRGAAQMVLEDTGHPEELKDKVCSPGGTTIEGVYALEKAGFRGAVMEAVKVGTEKFSRM